MTDLGIRQEADNLIDIHFRFCEALHGWEKTPNI